MTETKAGSRKLIGDWNVPSQDQGKTTFDVPDDQEVTTRVYKDHTYTVSSGVVYQKCGGGRRVIRKRIGGN